MRTPKDVLDATQERYRDRRDQRTSNQQKISAVGQGQQSPLTLDSPRRISLRMERVLEQPVVRRTDNGHAAGATVADLSVTQQEHLLERIIGGNNLLGVAFLELGGTVADSVARVHICDQFSTCGYGTGFLVSPRLLMTNNHVLPDPGVARYSHAEFHFQNGIDGKPVATSLFDLEPDTFFVTDSTLDFTLVAVSGWSRVDTGNRGIALSSFGCNRISADPGKIMIGENVNIVQHPDGHPKQIALQENEVIDRLDDFLHYRTDTAPGSSGSPLYNNQWEVVGIHHSGVPEYNEAGQILALDGSVWTEDMGEAQVRWVANEGARISSIVSRLQDIRPSLPDPQQALLLELLGPPAPPDLASSPVDSGAAGGTVASGPTGAGPLIAGVDAPGQNGLDGGSGPSAVVDASGQGAAVDAAAQSAAVDASAQSAVVDASGQSAVVTAYAPAPDGSSSVTVPLTVTVTVAAVPAAATAGVAPATGSDAGGLDEAVSIDPDYSHRSGYDPGFLIMPVPLPVLTAQQRANAAVNRQVAPDQDATVLNYEHYIVVLNRARRLAYYTAVNIDGRTSQRPQRETDRWIFDPRVDRADQVGGELYSANDLDLGHLTRRLDPAWGDNPQIVKVANDDTFHYSNCSPQHKGFNRNKALWAGLEDSILNGATSAQRRITVFNGPVFAEDDPTIRGVRIPLAFWKVVVFAGDDGPSATAYLISQKKLVLGMATEAAFNPETFQVPVHTITTITGLAFTHLNAWDPLADEKDVTGAANEALAIATPGHPLRSYSDLVL